ncbi:hypothetical protein QFC20_002525 [Naganishia adeliensis]|uniref:Uncharacterized protein n=1 Tax=Naganishia adeliensis TaxID=92952 RepID=A0ACC2WKF4_9TREE|nr:hypothetical protein QFC20_002525 [Naganishia adeliensis]
MPKATKSPRARLHSKAAASVKAPVVEEPQEAEEDMPMVEARAPKKARQAGVASKIPGKYIFHDSSLRTQFLQTSAHPYSRSHMRRLKRKEREDLSGGSLSAVQEALLGTLETDEANSAEVDPMVPEDEDVDEDADVVGKKKRRRGKGKKTEVQVTNGGFTMIGQGKGKTLKPKQRQQEIQLARARMGAVIANPVFKANPFAAIREHAGNTLIKHKTET